MDEYPDIFANDHHEAPPPGSRNVWVVITLAALAVAGVAFVYGYEQQNKVGQLALQESAANATISDLQRQLSTSKRSNKPRRPPHRTRIIPGPRATVCPRQANKAGTSVTNSCKHNSPNSRSS